MAVLTSYTDTSGSRSVPVGDASGNEWEYAQSFEISEEATVTSVMAYFATVSAGLAGNLVVTIETDNEGEPSGTLADANATKSVDHATLSSDSWNTFTFDSGFTLAGYTTYWLHLAMSQAQGSNNNIDWRSIYPGAYSDGNACRYFSGSWTALTSEDCTFQIIGASYSYEDIAATISGSSSLSGTLSAFSVTDLTATITGTSSLSGVITLYPNWQTSNFRTLRRLIAIGNDEVWSEDVAGTMTQVADSVGDIDTSDMLSACEAYQKIFIANGTNKKVLDFINDKLTIASALTTPPLKGDTLTQATSGAAMLVDSVSADKKTIYGYRTTSATFDTTNTVSSDDAGGDTMDPATFTPATATSRSSGPFWYDWTKHPSKTTAMPSKAYLICTFRGRLVLAGNSNDPHQWYMSRQTDPFDFDYASGDAQSAVAGTNADAGKIGDVVRALIPYHDDYLFFGCANSIWLLDGDPTSGGTLQPLSDSEGIHGAYSWCFDADSNLWFWGTSGICMIPPGAGKPIPKTAVSLPNLLDDEDIDPSQYRIVFGYDKKRAGIFITITKLSDGTNSCYWYDLKTEGLFPETYPEQCGAYSLHYYNSNDDGYSDLLIGCRDGYIRKWNDAAKDDDIGLVDEAIDSYVLMPIMPIGGDADRYGRIRSTTFVNAGGNSGGEFSDSDSIEYSFYSGDSAEQVVEDIYDGAAAHTSGTISGLGRNNRIRSRVRGAYVGLKLGNDNAGETWALERVDLELDAKGRVK